MCTPRPSHAPGVRNEPLSSVGDYHAADPGGLHQRGFSRGNPFKTMQLLLRAICLQTRLRWSVITVGANPGESTMSTLFGNDIAVEYSRKESAGNYPPGSVLSFVTWQRQEDGRWFGARMPARVKSVEFVEFTSSEEGRSAVRYRLYSGYPLKQTESPAPQADARVRRLVSLRAAVMP